MSIYDGASDGPVSSMPGSLHDFHEGSKCDTHQDRLAIKNVQGETDSFGAEYILMCKECYDEYRAYMCSEEARTGQCDWCKQLSTTLRDHREYEEGLAGRLYRVCDDCRTRELRELELQDDSRFDDDFELRELELQDDSRFADDFDDRDDDYPDDIALDLLHDAIDEEFARIHLDNTLQKPVQTVLVVKRLSRKKQRKLAQMHAKQG